MKKCKKAWRSRLSCELQNTQHNDFIVLLLLLFFWRSPLHKHAGPKTTSTTHNEMDGVRSTTYSLPPRESKIANGAEKQILYVPSSLYTKITVYEDM